MHARLLAWLCVAVQVATLIVWATLAGRVTEIVEARDKRAVAAHPRRPP